MFLITTIYQTIVLQILYVMHKLKVGNEIIVIFEK